LSAEAEKVEEEVKEEVIEQPKAMAAPPPPVQQEAPPVAKPKPPSKGDAAHPAKPNLPSKGDAAHPLKNKPHAPPPRKPKVDPMFDSVEVRVIEAKNLKNMESFGKMSPYVVVWVNFEPHEKNTTVCDGGGVEPKWDELIKWKARGKIEDLRMKVIVWDKEPMGFDDYVGGTDLDVRSLKKGETGKMWVDITQHTQPAGSVLLQVTLG